MSKDPFYEANINRLIPIAVKEAKKKVKESGVSFEPRPGKVQPYYRHCFFTEYFHQSMIRLAIENELRTF